MSFDLIVFDDYFSSFNFFHQCEKWVSFHTTKFSCGRFDIYVLIYVSLVQCD